jgi:hypothetical protein
MSTFKKWCWGAVATGAAFILVGIIGLVTGAIPQLVIAIIEGVGLVLGLIGVPFLAKPTPPAPNP